MPGKKKTTAKKSKKTTRRSKAELDALVEEATIDAYGDEEQLMGLFSMIEENFALPFETTVLGVTVEVEKVDLVGRVGGYIVAICKRGRHLQAIPITTLPLPSRRPEGAEWIDAYRHWLGE